MPVPNPRRARRRGPASSRAAARRRDARARATPAFADGVVAVVHASLSVGQAILLGLVEGFTEYLPISSTGHLIVTSRILDVGQHGKAGDAIKSYEIAIQAGAILAVLGAVPAPLRHDGRGAAEPQRRRSATPRRVVIAFVPAAVVGADRREGSRTSSSASGR